MRIPYLATLLLATLPQALPIQYITQDLNATDGIYSSTVRDHFTNHRKLVDERRSLFQPPEKRKVTALVEYLDDFQARLLQQIRNTKVGEDITFLTKELKLFMDHLRAKSEDLVDQLKVLQQKVPKCVKNEKDAKTVLLEIDDKAKEAIKDIHFRGSFENLLADYRKTIESIHQVGEVLFEKMKKQVKEAESCINDRKKSNFNAFKFGH